MVPRYSRPEMTAIWTPEARFRIWFEIEAHATDALAELGVVPKEARIQTLKGFHWVTDAQYMMIPKGVSDEKLAVLLDLIRHMLTPQQQAYTYDEGYFYPGPAVKDVPLSMAPESSQKAIREFGRPEYDKLIAENPMETPLEPEKMVVAFRIWDEQVGGAKRK